MLDINLIRTDPDKIKTALKNRQNDPKLVDKVLRLDKDYKTILFKVEQIRSQQNQLSRQIKGSPTADQRQQGTDLKNQLKAQDKLLKKVQTKLDSVLELIPNIPSSDTPIGKDDTENVVQKTVGKIPKFDFKPLDHVDLGKKLDIIDVDKAGQVSGPRLGFLKNQAAVLEMAVMFWAFKKLVDQGFTAMVPPAMIKADVESKMGYTSNKNLKDAYYLFDKDNLVFIGSSEHSVVPYHINEILDANKLPLKYVNFSPCFRREAGTYGQDTRGLFRVHFFNKVEMNIFTLPDLKVSDKMCLQMLALEEQILDDLALPYQVVKCCTGDLPQPNRRMFDINTWFPGQNKYRETHSCSNCTDYQARRLNTRVKLNGKNQFVHILNATVATDRLVLAILENFQTKNGTINIPQVLHPYTNFTFIKPKKS